MLTEMGSIRTGNEQEGDSASFSRGKGGGTSVHSCVFDDDVKLPKTSLTSHKGLCPSSERNEFRLLPLKAKSPIAPKMMKVAIQQGPS